MTSKTRYCSDQEQELVRAEIREGKRVQVDDNNGNEYEEIEDPVVQKIFVDFNAKLKAVSKGLPCGYRFSPTDSQIVDHYLFNWIMCKPLSSNVVKDIDLYKFDADDLPLDEFQCCKKNIAYFFTKLERKYSKGQLPSRTTKSGYWKATGREVLVHSNKQQQEAIGYKKILVFYSGKTPSGTKTGWVMHEFRLHPSNARVEVAALDDSSIFSKIHEYVLCRIQYKKRKEKRVEKKRSVNDQQSSESSESSETSDSSDSA